MDELKKQLAALAVDLLHGWSLRTKDVALCRDVEREAPEVFVRHDWIKIVAGADDLSKSAELAREEILDELTE